MEPNDYYNAFEKRVQKILSKLDEISTPSDCNEVDEDNIPIPQVFLEAFNEA